MRRPARLRSPIPDSSFSNGGTASSASGRRDTHASGFLVDAKGLVVTNQRGIGAATSAEVQLTRERKVAARVLAADAERDVAVLRIDPTAVAGVRPVPLACPSAGKPPDEGADIFTIGEPLRGEKDMTSGVVRGVKPKEIATDFVLPSGSAGGPVFSAAAPSSA